MRTRFIVQFVSLALIMIVGAVWVKSRAAAADLQARLSALTTFRRNTARELEEKRDRLRAALAEANRRRPAEVNATSVAPAPTVQASPAAPSLVLGEWRSAQDWRNEGQATAPGTVATLLWAAAGGDVAALLPLIDYDEASRTQARALFDSLPPATRLAFPTPETLVAGLTIHAVPTRAVQLSWFHERDADHATVGLLLGAPDQAAPAELHAMPAADNNPPMLADPYSTQFTVLSLQRSATGWRVIIPAGAIERLARQIKPPAT